MQRCQLHSRDCFITYRVTRTVRAMRDVSEVPLAELSTLTGRIAVVTGGARGIGFACCARLVEAGATVLVADVDEREAASAAAATRAGRGRGAGRRHRLRVGARGSRPRRRPPRPAGRLGQLGGCLPRLPAARALRRRVGTGSRRQPPGDAVRCARGGPGHGRRGPGRRDRQHRLDGRLPGRRPRRRPLCRLEVRGARPHAEPRGRTRRARDPCPRGRPDCHADAGPRGGAGVARSGRDSCSTSSALAYRSGGSPSPTTSPGSSSSARATCRC